LGLAQTSLRYPEDSDAEGRVPIRSVSIEAPTSNAATQLAHDLLPYAKTDVVPIDEERWEVRIEDSSEEELDVVLSAVARWAADHSFDQTQVLVDGERVDLPES
jgi:hypothetical protein